MDLFIVPLFEVHHTKTLANQELGLTLWPLASLSQGDLTEKVLRLEVSDYMSLCCCPRGVACPARVGDPWSPSPGHRPGFWSWSPGCIVGELCKRQGPRSAGTHQRAWGAHFAGLVSQKQLLKVEFW